MNVFTGPNDLLHGDEHLEELEDWELRERFFNALRDLTEAADTVEKLKSPKWTPYPEDIEALQDTLEELKYSLKQYLLVVVAKGRAVLLLYSSEGSINFNNQQTGF